MQRQTEQTFTLGDADPYLRIQASRYEVSFTATERNGSEYNTVAIKLPKAARQTMMNCVINEIGNLRHADSDDRAQAIEWLTEAQDRIRYALRQLQPEESAAN
jgi:hypothetical protein